jgi:hypothetical protein
MQYKTSYVLTTVTHRNIAYADNGTMKMQSNLPPFVTPTHFTQSTGLTLIKHDQISNWKGYS